MTTYRTPTLSTIKPTIVNAISTNKKAVSGHNTTHGCWLPDVPHHAIVNPSEFKRHCADVMASE